METPVAIFSGDQDWLATPADIAINLRRVGRLRNLVFDWEIEDWNHIDFTWGRNANTIIYDKIVMLIQGIVPEKVK